VQSAIPKEVIEEEIEKALQFLVRWPGVRRIWLFGSAAKQRPLDWRSDLDFAVEGLSSDDHYRAWSELDQLMKMPVDLVLMEEADMALKDEILRWGKLLYDA
jgi:predicted nucleotidyltransferase